jgi:two-component system chemotaxis sensor kinase CheA
MESIDAAELLALRTAEQQYRAMTDYAPVPIALTRMSDSQVVFVNKAAIELTPGGTRYEGAAADLYVDPEARPRLIAKLRAEGRVSMEPLQMRRADGTIGDFLLSLQPVMLQGVAHLVTFFLDVSEQKVAERALHSRNEEMGLILSNVREGLLIVDAAGRIQPGCSSVVNDWFACPAPGTLLWDAARNVDASFADWMAVCWDSVTDNVLPLALALDQLPRLLRMGDRHVQVTVNPIGLLDDDKVPERFLIILTDITESVARQNVEALQKDVLSLLDRLIRDRQGVLDFLHEVGDLVKHIAAWRDDDDSADVAVLKRTIHTVKGNCAMMGVTGIAAICHAVEDTIADDAERPQAKQLRPIVAAWEPLNERMRTFLESQPGEQLDVTAEDLSRVRELLHSDVSGAEAMLASWQRPPLRRRLQRLATQAQSLARRLGKEVHVVVNDHQLRLDPLAFSGFWAAFAHLMRNAVDHGIEAANVRVANGKSATGTIRLTTMLVPTDTGHGVLEVELVDDGAGINWTAIADKARALGLPCATHDDLEQALFAEGLSTAEAVTDTSGRGVGTSALRAAVLEAGGSIEVTSPLSSGSGTRFVCSLPLPVVADGAHAPTATAAATHTP